jgi:hypothetical protein
MSNESDILPPEPGDARLPERFDRLLAALETRLAAFGASRWWRLKLAALCSLCTIFYATPNFTTLAARETPLLWKVIYQQSAEPLKPVMGLDPASHEAKRVFRLTMPLLAKLCPGDSPRSKMLFLFGVQYAAGVLFFVLCASLFLELLRNHAAAVLLTLSTAFIYPGQACFYDLFGFFDGVAFVCLLLTFVCRSPAAIFACLLAAFWVDERAIVAGSFTYLWIKLEDRDGTGWRRLLLPDRRSLVVPAAILVTLGLRVWLSREHGFALPSAAAGGVGFTDYFRDARLFRLPIGLLSPFKLHWILLGLAGVWLWLNRRFALLALGLAAVLASLCAAVVVVDITRSLAYAFPAVVIAVRILAQAMGPRFWTGLAVIVMILSVFTPSYNVMSGAAWMYPLPVKLMFSPLWWR